MNKIALLMSLSALLIFSCKKEDKGSNTASTPKTYEQKLEGNWELTAVSYETTIPDFTGSGSPINIKGDGQDVSGDFMLTRNPNKVVYNLSFNAQADPFNSGTPFTLPVSFGSSGTWTTTSDASKLIVTDQGGEELIFNVEVNEDDTQVFSTTVSQSFNVGLPITLDVDLLLTFKRG